MLGFCRWLENVSVVSPRTTSGTGAPPEPPGDDDGGDGGDDDGQWSWDNVARQFGGAIQAWVDGDPFAGKCKRAVLDRIFAPEPQIEGPYFWTDREEFIDPEGDAEIRVEWSIPSDPIYQALYTTLRDPRKCVLWKVLGLRPEEWYPTLDQGDLYDFIWHLFTLSLSGVNYDILYQNPGASNAQTYNRKQSQWEKDKVTIMKYAAFIGRDWEDRVQEYVREEIVRVWTGMKHPTAKVQLYLLGSKPRGQLYGDHFQASVSYDFSYRVE